MSDKELNPPSNILGEWTVSVNEPPASGEAGKGSSLSSMFNNISSNESRDDDNIDEYNYDDGVNRKSTRLSMIFSAVEEDNEDDDAEEIGGKKDVSYFEADQGGATTTVADLHTLGDVMEFKKASSSSSSSTKQKEDALREAALALL